MKNPGALTGILTILGCGTSTGTPILTCPCSVCRSKNPKNQRTRCSAWWQVPTAQGLRHFIIDTGPDFRLQALRAKISRVDAILYTHPHADHLNGIDELRAYNYAQKASIPVYGNEWMIRELRERFGYIFKGGPIEGGPIPSLTPHVFNPQEDSLDIQGARVIPIPLPHGSRETVGYRIDSVAYVTDCSYIPDLSLERLKGLETLVLDCVQLKPHPTHLHLEKSLEIVSELSPGRTYLTHLGHDFDYAKWVKKLPKGVRFAYDGLKIETKTETKLKKRRSNT